jgi:hypothetical protein
MERLTLGAGLSQRGTMQPMALIQLIALWQDFLRRFADVLDGVQAQHLRQVWNQPQQWGAFYAGWVFPQVACRWHPPLAHQVEFLNIDHVLLRNSQNHQVPWVFIESENNAHSAHEEVRKLCAVSAPLRVLVTRSPWWDDTPNFWPRGALSEAGQLLPHWAAIPTAHNHVWPNPGLLALLVAEQCSEEWHRPPTTWPTHAEFQNYRLRFYAYRFEVGGWQNDGRYQRYLEGPAATVMNGQRQDGWPIQVAG